MALEVVWMLTALIILATVCIGVLKGILGDVVQYSRGPRDFLVDRSARYGEPFTVSLMGKTYTVISSPAAINFVVSAAHASFPTAYPVQFLRLLAQKDMSGERHPHYRKVILSATTGDGLHKQVPFISSLAEKTVKSWENQTVVNLVEEFDKFTFNVGMHINWRDVEPGSKEMDQIRTQISYIGEGLVSLPINFPGFSYHKALKTRKVLVSRIQSEISRRRKAGIQQDDVLNGLMSLTEVEVPDYDICCIVVALLYASSAAGSVLTAWIIKYLDDFPEIRHRVQEEQDCLRPMMIEDKSLTWFKPKSSMPYTLQVIYETLRMESIALFPRQANKDVDYNGLVFRKGSHVWASASSLHYDPKYYPNPKEFNPSRFDEKLKPNTFMPFGKGSHFCPGNELTLTTTMFIIHHLVTTYSWERCGPYEGVKQLPIRKLVGFPIRLVKRNMI